MEQRYIPQSINPYYADVEAVRKAGELLPAEYQPMDEAWLEKNAEAIDILKAAFAEKGGIHLLTVGDYQVLCRAPSREILNKSAKLAQSSSRVDADVGFVGQCLISPAPAVLAHWMNDHAGLASAFAAKLLEISKVNQEAQAKKL
jgi:hypothetical protein